LKKPVMNVKKIYNLICLTLSGVIAANAQVCQPHSLYFMQTIPQISQMNPAFQPRANGYVALPNVNVDVRLPLAMKDIFQKQGNGWYTFLEDQYDYKKLWKSIGENAAMFNVAADLDIFGFGFRVENSYLSFGLSEHVYFNNALPSDVFKMTETGFPPEETLFDLSHFDSQTVVYKQLRIGFSTKIGDRLTVGVNVKPLSGQAAAISRIKKMELRTSQQQWSFDVKGDIYSSAPIDLRLDEEGKISELENRDLEDKAYLQDYLNSFNNPGIAFDLGAAYQINERLAVSAALNNLGFISWTKDLNGISANGSYKFNGIEYDIVEDDGKDMWETLTDTLKNVVEYRVQHNKFKTTLMPVVHLGATYNLSKSVSIGLLSRSTFWKNNVQQSFNASLCLQPYSFVAFNMGATWQVKNNVYLGGGFTLFLGPLQFYLLTDYAPVYYSMYRIEKNNEQFENGKERIAKFPFPERQKSITIRTGLNLVFGKHGYLNKPMLDKRAVGIEK